MNKLRRLIAQVKRQDSTFEEAIEYARWCNTHVEAIADLIDAAQKVDEMFMRTDATPLMRRERDVLDDHSDALSKLTEDKFNALSKGTLLYAKEPAPQQTPCYSEVKPEHQARECGGLNSLSATPAGSNRTGEDIGQDEHRVPAQSAADRGPDTCPVCGYYCLGKGGIGCIDKPHYSAPPAQGATPDTDLWKWWDGTAQLLRRGFSGSKCSDEFGAIVDEIRTLRAENERLRELVRSYQLGALPSGDGS